MTYKLDIKVVGPLTVIENTGSDGRELRCLLLSVLTLPVHHEGAAVHDPDNY